MLGILSGFSRRFLAIAIYLTMALAALPVAPVFAARPLDDAPAKPLAGALTLREFAASLQDAPDGHPAGLYVAGTLALPIVQQPANQPAFVSSQSGVLTQFKMAESYGTVGLLAHNTLAGAEFEKLQPGQYASVLDADGQARHFRISAVERYAALDPANPYSDFLSADGARLSAADLFEHVYHAPDGRLVLQTCIANQGNPSWGRLFVIAEPLN